MFFFRSQRREQLVKAWNLIDPLGYGEISVYDEQLKALFRILKPQVSWIASFCGVAFDANIRIFKTFPVSC